MTDAIESLYGFRFPSELSAVAEIARSLRPDDPARAFEPIGLRLCGPFDVVFRGELPGRLSPLLHFRFVHDPPELFTVAMEEVDRAHLGYWMDAGPAEVLPVCVADPDEPAIREIGASLGDALKAKLARVRADLLMDDEVADAEALTRIADALSALPTHRSPPRTFARRTRDGRGVVAPASARDGYAMAPAGGAPRDYAAAARRAQEQGAHGEALGIARDLWTMPPDTYRAVAGRIAVAAYDALGRPHLARVAAVHAAGRHLPRVGVDGYSSADVDAMLADFLDPSALREPLSVEAQERLFSQSHGALLRALRRALADASPVTSKGEHEAAAVLVASKATGESREALLARLARAQRWTSWSVITRRRDLDVAAWDREADRLLARADGVLGADELAEALLGAHRFGPALPLVPRLDIARTIEGGTILHLAARVGAVEVTRALLDRGADPSTPNAYGQTPRDLAKAL